MENKTITFGGGCFWCTDAIFRETVGVLEVKSGYSGGFIKRPGYREVRTGRTGHAEVIQVTYDPAKISLQDLLKNHLVTHDPTTVNQQGADKGSQYRSIIF
ncbi:peptide-methionine (S)-S-oxide reductase MsrA, partial [Elizabethkingia anophelis]|uniref:peptide-methionine (S)-S-oxide reductase MsrA n=1 Tax=Elizabethkingia anophelis TaxID=1117645 RepID=UPI00162A9322